MSFVSTDVGPKCPKLHKTIHHLLYLAKNKVFYFHLFSRIYFETFDTQLNGKNQQNQFELGRLKT